MNLSGKAARGLLMKSIARERIPPATPATQTRLCGHKLFVVFQSDNHIYFQKWLLEISRGNGIESNPYPRLHFGRNFGYFSF